MLHNSTNPEEEPYPLQVELNTIASSFGCLSSKLSKMHKHLASLPSSTYTADDLPDNKAATNIAAGLAAALEEYKRQKPKAINPVVVMVVQPGESNSCDQRDLEFLLQEEHGVRLIRRSLKECATTGKYSADGEELLLPDGSDGRGGALSEATAAVVYFRAGYTPDDYPSDTEWEGRSLIEHSAAVKCPDVFYHLVGTKKVQQALAIPGTLRRFVTSDEVNDVLFSSFAGLYSLGEGDDSEVVKMALERPNDFVLKPQREGGGNNLYDDELVEALNKMSFDERGAYILMQKIRPPAEAGTLIKGGAIVYQGETVCELGVFGVSLREYKTEKVLMDTVGGHILRSKSTETDEGGVAAGYAFLSSPRLI
jgi:glutathione synthetase